MRAAVYYGFSFNYLELEQLVIDVGQLDADLAAVRLGDAEHQVTLDLQVLDTAVAVGHHRHLLLKDQVHTVLQRVTGWLAVV